jgi:hypothetical protein
MASFKSSDGVALSQHNALNTVFYALCSTLHSQQPSTYSFRPCDPAVSSFSQSSHTTRLIMAEFDRRDANMHMLNKMDSVQDKTLASLARTQRQVVETEEVGIKTLEELRRQKQQQVMTTTGKILSASFNI